jgi:hypothetical protein
MLSRRELNVAIDRAQPERPTAQCLNVAPALLQPLTVGLFRHGWQA